MTELLPKTDFETFNADFEDYMISFRDFKKEVSGTYSTIAYTDEQISTIKQRNEESYKGKFRIIRSSWPFEEQNGNPDR